MTRIACLMMQKDEELLLRPWLLYHGYLFGFENLYVFDNGSTSDTVISTLRDFIDIGVNVEHSFNTPEDFDNKGNVIGNQIMAFRQEDRYDIAIPLDCDEFLAANDFDRGISCAHDVVLHELERVFRAGVMCRTQRCLDNRPGFLDVFRYVEHAKSIVIVREFMGIDHGFHEADLPAGVDYDQTSLIHIHLHFKPFQYQILSARNKLRPYVDVRDLTALSNFSGVGNHLTRYFFMSSTDYYVSLNGYELPVLHYDGLVRLLGVLMEIDELRTRWEAGRPAGLLDDLLVIDLERFPFRPAEYHSANPDLPHDAFDALLHFVSAGYFEARQMEASDSGLAEVADRLTYLRSMRRDGRSGYVGLALTMNRLGRGPEAERLLANAMNEYGITAELLREYGLLALYDHAFDEASRRWAAFRDKFPENVDGYLYGAMACRRAGELIKAEQIALSGLARYSDHAELAIEHVDIVTQQGDWTRARGLLEAMLLREPGNDVLRDRISDLAFQQELSRMDAEYSSEIGDIDAPVLIGTPQTETPTALEMPGGGNAEEMREFFMRFESLGHSCEFGLVQRHYGAEPIGLLRWNSIHAPRLRDALVARFEGIDDPDNIFLEPFQGEYVLRDHRYATAMHTFKMINATEPNSLMIQSLKRMTYLRRKLLLDLESAEKIFVHVDDQWRSDHELRQLYEAFKSYGKGVLLYVRATTAPGKAGTTEIGGDGLILGYIGKLGRDEDGSWNIAFDSWLSLCRDAAAYTNLKYAA